MKYDLTDWLRENGELAGGARPGPCPQCRRLAFYGTFKAAGPRYYRACKFCGFWQHIDQEPETCIATVHGCSRWLTVAGARYIWWVPPGEPSYDCPYCAETVSAQDAKVTAPAQDPGHAWWSVPQDLPTQADYKVWWAEHEFPNSTFGYLG